MNSVENSLPCLLLIHAFWEICSRSAGQIIRCLYGTTSFITTLCKPITVYPTLSKLKSISQPYTSFLKVKRNPLFFSEAHLSFIQFYIYRILLKYLSPNRLRFGRVVSYPG
jgi:hypothetical protein